MKEPNAAHRVSGSWTRAIMAGLETVGLDGRTVCEHAGLDYEVMSDSTARVPRTDLGRFWAAAAELTDDPLFGLHAGEKTLSPPNHILASLAMSAKSVGEGINMVARFANIIAEGSWHQLERRDSGVWMLLPGLDEGLLAPHHAEFIVATGHRLFTVMTTEAFEAKQVRFAHPYRGHQEEYQRVFRCPVSFDRECTAFVVSEETWATQIRNWDPVWMNRLESFAIELAERLDAPGFVNSVRHVLHNLLPQRQCDMAAVAHKLHTSERTLQRRLREEGTTFRDVVDSTRRTIVRQSLRRELGEQEIVRRAGFGSVRTYRRALQRWREDEAL
ncbi:MAG: AraC family transcriptional regulator ligand-binding domain-containing protein [Myxococcota bacterium]